MDLLILLASQNSRWLLHRRIYRHFHSWS